MPQFYKIIELQKKAVDVPGEKDASKTIKVLAKASRGR